MDADGGSSTARTGAGAGAGVQQPQRPSWRSSLVAYAAATSSSTSGSLSTTYYTSGSSYLQSSSSGDGGLAPPVALLTLLKLEEEREKTRRHIMCFVQEFMAAGDDEDAAAMVLERWLSYLGISWVLSIATDGKWSAAAFILPQRLRDLARSWIDALTVIRLFMSAYFNELCNLVSICSVTAAYELVRFLQSTFLKMFPFADAVVSAKVDSPCIQHNLWEALVPAEEKLQILIGMRHALSQVSEVSEHILWSPHFQESIGIVEQTSSLLSGKLDKLGEAVWDTVDGIRTSIMSPMDPQTLERSPDIHRATRFTVNCIKLLDTNDVLLYEIVKTAASLGKYVPQDNGYGISHPFRDDPLAMLAREMVSSLQENIAQVSQSFSDQSLRFLFLLNNTHFMWQQLRNYPSYAYELQVCALFHKIEAHIQRYLQMSWIPMVSGLHDPTPLCLGRYSPLAKFESEFQKTYTAQKLWKVPDPELRGRLCKVIIETVIPPFAKYVEDNKITAPRITQQELEDMLKDLFEG